MRIFFPATVLGLILATASPGWAQGGVVVGVNFAEIQFPTNDNDVPEPDRRTGFAAGVFFRLPLGQAVSIQPEVLYSQKGAKFEDGGAKATIELDYLDIPVLARITAGGETGLVVFAGPSFGFKLRARGKFDDGTDETDEDIGDEVENFDWGLVAGAGFQGKSVFLDGRYQWGLSNINKDAFDVTEVKNRVLSVMLGFKF